MNTVCETKLTQIWRYGINGEKYGSFPVEDWTTVGRWLEGIEMWLGCFPEEAETMADIEFLKMLAIGRETMARHEAYAKAYGKGD